jgi:tRNA(adenine34) deaminase
VAEHLDDEQWMRLAIEQAKKGIRTLGGAEVGCVIVDHGRLVCEAHNEAEGLFDPTAHAEMVAIRRLCRERETLSLAGVTLYCTLQPCAMCTAASLWAGVSRIVYGAGRADVHPLYFVERHRNTEDLIADAFRNDIEIASGVLREECAQFYLSPRDPAPAVPDPAHDPTVPPR